MHIFFHLHALYLRLQDYEGMYLCWTARSTVLKRMNCVKKITGEYSFSRHSQTVSLINLVTKCKQSVSRHLTWSYYQVNKCFLNHSSTVTHHDKHATTGLWCEARLPFPRDVNLLSGIILAISLRCVIPKAFKIHTTPNSNGTSACVNCCKW